MGAVGSSWLEELRSVVMSSKHSHAFPRCEVRFRVDGHQFGLDLASGDATDGSAASSELSGSDEIFERIVSGQDTLQAAYRPGRVTLTGDPEPFLRLSVLLDRCASLRVCVQ